MKKTKDIEIISLLLGVALLLFVIPSVAKYIIRKGQQSELASQNFYFSSNFLKSDEVPTYELYGNSVKVEVRNYIDSLKINSTDIKFTVTADSGTVDISSGRLAGEALSSANITLTYVFAEDELQKEIIVSATGTGDFVQTLKAKFVLIKPNSLMYQIKDQANRDYAELYIYTGNTVQNVIINWDKTKLLIDETNDYVFGNTTLNAEKNSVTISDIPSDTTIKIVFFKKNIAKDNTCDITKSDGNININ